jgi:hypothetical protein
MATPAPVSPQAVIDGLSATIGQLHVQLAVQAAQIAALVGATEGDVNA